MIAIWSQQADAPDEVRDEIAHARALDRLMVLQTDGADIPMLFGERNFMPFDGWADTVKRQPQLDAIVAEVRRRVATAAYQVVKTDRERTGSTLVAPPEFGDIRVAPDKLVGRDAELAMLRDAWTSLSPGKVNAVVLHALGGAGKSALLRTFANGLVAEGGGGAARIYGWSAYSQGSGEQKLADADGFISKALGDFGWQGHLPGDPVERARALAKLIQKERVLLLLDGLEPLQEPPSLNKGRFKDKGLAELIKLLAGQNPGLVVLTTRQEVPELAGFGPLVVNHALDELSDRAGAELLVELGVHGRQRELEAAVHELQGHALSVTLFGTYLVEVCGGDIRHRDQFDFSHVTLSPEEQSELATDRTIIPAKRAARVMRAYLEQFERLAKDGATAGLGGPERTLLHLLGLFDRPADGPAIGALLARHIPGLTDDLFYRRAEPRHGWLGRLRQPGLEPVSAAARMARFREAKARLRSLRLLASGSVHDPNELDAHPVVRAYFAGQLDETAPEAAKVAHDTLYRHYATAASGLPDTLEEMQPLFQAVQHGVKAGQAQSVFDDVFWPRIMRGNNGYIVRVLGAFGPFISACSNFFESPWRKVRSDLRPDTQAWLLNSAAFALAALGRLADSAEPRRAGLEAEVARMDWAGAARAGGELTSLLRLLGRVPEALTVAQQATIHADRSGDNAQRAFSRTDLAATLLAAGDLDRSAALFAEAESFGADDHPDFPQLYSLPSYQYGDFALARGDGAQALARGHAHLAVAERFLGRGLGLHDIGYGHLLIGRAQDMLGDMQAAAAALDAAVAGLRKSGRSDFLPLALLARATHRRRRVAVGEAEFTDAVRADLTEAEDIAGEEMRLYLTDLALERARLALDVPSAYESRTAARTEAQAQTAKAAQLISETGYHRRDPDLTDLQARLVDM